MPSEEPSSTDPYLLYEADEVAECDDKDVMSGITFVVLVYVYVSLILALASAADSKRIVSCCGSMPVEVLVCVGRSLL